MEHKHQLISKHWTVRTNALAVSSLYRLRWVCFPWKLEGSSQTQPRSLPCYLSNVNRMLPQLVRNIGYSVLQNQSPAEHGHTHRAPVLQRLKQEDWVLKLAWSKQDAISMPKALGNGLMFIETGLFIGGGHNLSSCTHGWLNCVCSTSTMHRWIRKFP